MSKDQGPPRTCPCLHAPSPTCGVESSSAIALVCDRGGRGRGGGAEEEEEELPEVVRDPGEASVRTVAPVRSAEAQDPAGHPRLACISRRI